VNLKAAYQATQEEWLRENALLEQQSLNHRGRGRNSKSISQKQVTSHSSMKKLSDASGNLEFKDDVKVGFRAHVPEAKAAVWSGFWAGAELPT
jgi:hypothetical protein